MPAVLTKTRRELIEDAARRYGLKPEEGLAEHHRANGTRAYPTEMIPKRSGGTAGAGRGGPESVDTNIIEACWALYRCLTVRADGIAGLPLRLWKGSGDDAVEVTEGGLGTAYHLFNPPNPSWSLSRLLAMTEWALNTSRRGAYWILDGWTPEGKPTEIWYADPRTVRAVRGSPTDEPENRYISHYEVMQPGQTSGKPKRFERWQVVWFQAPHPFAEFESFPALLAAIESAGLAMASLYANRTLHETGMTGAGYVVPKDGIIWDDNQRIEIGGMFATTVKGQSGWHRMMVTDRNDFEVHEFPGSISPRDAQFTNLMGITTDQICIASGVPEPIIKPTDSTFTNVDGSISILWSLTLIPRSNLIAQTISSQILDPHFPKEADSAELWTGDIPQLQDDEAAKWNLDSSQLSAILDLADRVARGYPMESAHRAATFFIGVPEDVATALIPPRVVEEDDAALLPVVDDVKMPDLGELRLLLGAVQAKDVPRDSATAILEAVTGDRMLATRIVGTAGTSVLASAPVGEVSEARYIVEDVVAGKIPRASGMALLARLFSDPVSAAAVIADAEAVCPPDCDTPDTVASVDPPASIIRFHNGRGYRVLADGDTVEYLSEARQVTEGDVTVYGSDAHARIWKLTADQIAALQPPIKETARDLLAGQHADAQRGMDSLTDREIERIVNDLGVDPRAMSDADNEALSRAMSEAVLGRGFGPKWITRGTEDMGRRLADLTKTVSEETARQLGFGAESATAAMETIVTNRAAFFATETTNTSWTKVGDVVARGIRNGLSTKAIADNVAAIGVEWQGPRSERIARTETHTSATAAARETVRASGLDANRVWLSALIDTTRDDHRSAHGQRVGLNEPYIVGGMECDGPGNCGSADQDVNCLCVESWEVE